MSKTLLATVQDICSSLTLPRPTVALSSPDAAVRQLVWFAQEVGTELAQDVAWPHLRKTASIATVNGTSAYTVDYTTSGNTYTCDRIICDTGWDSTQHWRFVGGVSDQEWNRLTYGFATQPLHKLFRTTDKNAIEVFPTPDATAATLVLSFITDMWALSASSVPQTAFALDSDTHTFDNRLFDAGIRWRFLRANGLAYDEEYKRYTDRLDLRLGQVRSPPVLSIARRRGRHFIDLNNVPETGYGS